MKNLILNSLEIRNFRCFKHLQIERLGRVNLIVGKNNVGKSTLLEALQLYTYGGSPNLIWKILQARDESKLYSPKRASRLTPESLLPDLKHLFYGRKEIGRSIESISIGPSDSLNNIVFISVGWYARQRVEEGLPSHFRLLQPDEYDMVENATARFTIKRGELSRSYPLKSAITLEELEIKANSIFIAPGGLDDELIGTLWNEIALTDLEKDVVEAMRIIAPGVERLNVVGNFDSRERFVGNGEIRERETIPIVKIVGSDERITLRSLGDGMQRIFGLALALVNAKDGILLIDEIENGLHYSVQLDIWQMVFQLAHRLNVQVFATTHSRDCIEAFQKASKESVQEEGLLIRLQNKADEISAVLYDEEDLAVAAREQIEVR